MLEHGEKAPGRGGDGLMALHLPTDAVTGAAIDADLAADYLELAAFFAADASVRSTDLVNAVSLAAAEDHVDVDSEMRNGEEEIVSRTVARIEDRIRVLEAAYPFALDPGGDVLTCELQERSAGHAVYVVSLVLSNLRAVSSVLDNTGFHPDDHEARRLRTFFQYCATAALAAEVQGPAWSFGYPRPDGTGFVEKLKSIWGQLGDGCVLAQTGAPKNPKDDQVDVFAARPHPDRLPGFLLAAAQVATGKNWKAKSLKKHLDVFWGRWFAPQPDTESLVYMIVPFARPDDQFVDDVRVLGNVLHRLRVPRRVAEASLLAEAGVTIEGYDRLAEVMRWVADYRARARAAA